MGYSILDRDARLYTVRHTLLGAGAALLALLLVMPFFVARPGETVPVTHDMHQHVSVLRQVDAAVRTGELYPRWQPEFNKGYGLPWLNYYPPAFYWLAEVFYAPIGDPIDALFVVCVLMMIACGAATYWLAREFLSRGASAGAAVLYMIAPYHSLDLYWRGALAELAGFVFAPLIVLFAFRAGSGRGVRWIAALGLVHGVYLMTHVPVAYLMTLTIGAYAVTWAWMQRDWRIALRIVAGLAWGFACSAVYWLVAMLERKHVSDTFSTDFLYHRSYIVLGESDVFGDMVNLSFVSMAAALVASLLICSGMLADTQKRLVRILAVGTVFMITPYSIYVSKLIPNINSVSFAWRWMVIATLFVSLLAAMAIERLRAAPRTYAVLFLAAIAFNAVTTVRLIVLAFDKPSLAPALSYVETGFVPGRASDPWTLPEGMPPAVLVPDAPVEIVKWEPLRRELRVTVAQRSALYLRTYRFRGWTARIDGRREEFWMDQHGAQALSLTPGRHHVVVTFENPRTRVVLAWVSAIALLAAVVGVFFRARGGGRREGTAIAAGHGPSP